MDTPDEFVVFCENEYPRLVGAMSLYVGDVLVAEELAQEALVRACERWSSVSEMAAPGAWVYRVAVNVAKSRFRRTAAERRALNRKVHVHVHEDVDAAQSMTLRHAVADLPDRQRQAVILRYFLQWTAQEVADLMELTPSGVRSLTARGIDTLRDRFHVADANSTLEVPDAT